MNYSIFQSWSYVLYLIRQEEIIYCLKIEYCVPYTMQIHWAVTEVCCSFKLLGVVFKNILLLFT